MKAPDFYLNNYIADELRAALIKKMYVSVTVEIMNRKL